MCQLMRNEGITNQRPWLIFAWPKGHISSYGKSACIEVLRKTSSTCIGMDTNMGEVNAKGRFHLRSHTAIQRATSSPLSLYCRGVRGCSGTALPALETQTTHPCSNTRASALN